MDTDPNLKIRRDVNEYEWDDCQKNSEGIHSDDEAISDSPESSDGIGDELQEITVSENEGDTIPELDKASRLIFPQSSPGSRSKSNFHLDKICSSQNFRVESKGKPAAFSLKSAKITGHKRKIEEIPYTETRITERPSTCLAIGESRITERPASYLAIDEEEIADVWPTKRLKLTCEQIAILEESFELHNTVSSIEKEALAKRLKIQPRQVEVWFQNKRARLKMKKTENDCFELKHCLEEITEKYKKLKKEVIKLRVISEDYKRLQKEITRLKTSSPALGTATVMCPSCVSGTSGTCTVS